MFLVGKLQRRRPEPPPQLGSLNSSTSLLYLHDTLSGGRFLVDTGASRSVLPHVSSAPPSGPRLAAASGRIIPSWGTRLVPLKFGGSSFSWEFLLAGVDRPILGLDFLSAHGLVVDAAGRRVSRAGSGEFVCSLSSSASADALLAKLQQLLPDVRAVLDEFPGVLSDELPRDPPGMMSAILLRPLGVPCLPKLGGWTPTSCLLPRRSSTGWSRLASSAGPALLGPLPSTWSRNLTVPGDPVAITAD